ncbi:MAG: hypothetical protein IJ740_06695 [Ruminococcus sp.]|nr:hypothetical protein [Ruminococcus sp.]
MIKTGYITIPGSQNPDHILENYSIFDFELTDAEMQRMAELHTGQRYEIGEVCYEYTCIEWKSPSKRK